MSTDQLLLLLIPLPPLLAFGLIVLFTNKSKLLSTIIAVTAALLSWAGAMVLFFRAVANPELRVNLDIPWLPVGSQPFNIGVSLDPLTAATLFFVGWTVLMIFIYSVGYHNFGQPKGEHDVKGLPPEGATVQEHGHSHRVPSVEPMYSRFFAFIGLFAFGMYLLVVSNNLLTLFVGWEIMGLCSYLLIGFWYAKPSARAAAVKAFITTRIGDMFLLLGLGYLYSQTGSLSYSVIFSPENLEHLASTPAVGGFLGFSAAGLIGLLIFFGTVGKSAQFPLHVWLPDAMEGPTPVSAMIHAATMVSAGVYLVIRTFPLLSAGWEGHGLTAPMIAMAVIGTFTAIFAATIAVAQNDIKRVLAYSTISQLGFMIAALGIGAYVAAAFHLITHAFFKALLFLGSGSVIHGMEHGVLHTHGHEPGEGTQHNAHHVDPQDMLNMGGLAKKMPFTFWTFLIGGLSLSGFPLITAGFWSKDEILADAWVHNKLVFVVLAIAALLTAFYTMRQITLTFLGKPRTAAAEHASENKWTMVLPLVVLAFFAVVAGWVGIPEHFPVLGPIIHNNWFHHFVGSTLAEEVEALEFSWIPLLTSLAVALGGLLLGWLVYRNYRAGEKDPLEKALGPVHNFLKRKYFFDEIYDTLFVKPAYWLSETFAFEWVDRGLIDGILHTIARIMAPIGAALRKYFDKPVVNGFGDFVGEGTKWFGRKFRVIQTGQIQSYMVIALIFAFGTLFIYLFAVLPH
jgi:NADH-quinone oxidoreductase subunit L